MPRRVSDTAIRALEGTFRFLTEEDEPLLLEKAERVSYQKGDVLLPEGSHRQAIFLLRRGEVRIERGYLGRGIEFARLGAGEVFGEMSFLEMTGASASVVANEEVDVDVIEGQQMAALLASVPGFATRFYLSVAVGLSQRLREASGHLPPVLT